MGAPPGCPMPKPYTVASARLFLEPARDFTGLEGDRPTLKRVQPPASFISAARDELGLSESRIARRGPSVFSHFWNPPVQVIPRLAAPEKRQAFFASRARSLWDACCSSFETLPPRSMSFIISLLVEYELGPHVILSDEDSRFLFLDCKQRFVSALGAQRRISPGLSKSRAANQAWAQAAHEMRMRYGLPEERLQTIVREGTPRWNAMKQLPGARLSFAHNPAVHWIATPPPRPKYTARVARHPLEPGD